LTATYDDVRRLVRALPETSERVGGHRGGLQWRVKDRLFAWERPLGRKDRAALTDTPHGDVKDTDILAVRVADDTEKTALIDEDPSVFFTIPHFDGYAAILLRLDRIRLGRLEEAVTDAWLDRAPAKLAQAWLAEQDA
jgi:hypothetical protein